MAWKGWAAALTAVACGCASSARQEPPEPERTLSSSAKASTARAKPAEPDPREQFIEADRLYNDQLGAPGRDERFGAHRQVAALRRAIHLYERFIERADGDPQLQSVVERSRERIEDARATIEFLLGDAE
jgi:hypothetical protein